MSNNAASYSKCYHALLWILFCFVFSPDKYLTRSTNYCSAQSSLGNDHESYSTMTSHIYSYDQFVEALGIHHDDRDTSLADSFDYSKVYRDLYLTYMNSSHDFREVVHQQVVPLFRDASTKRSQGLDFWSLPCNFCESTFTTAMVLVRKSGENALLLESFVRNLGVLFCRLGKFASKYTVRLLFILLVLNIKFI